MTFKKLVKWRLWSSFIQNATILLIFNHCKSCGKFGNSSHIETGNFLMQNSEAIKVAVLGGGAVVAKPLCLVQMVKRTRDLEKEEE